MTRLATEKYQTLAERCAALCEQIAQGDKLACSDLFALIYRNNITPAAYRAMASKIAELTRAFHSSSTPAIKHCNLLFLQGVQSIYQRGFEHPETRRLLTTARKAGNSTADTLLALYHYAYDFKWFVGRGETFAAKRFRFMQYFKKRDDSRVDVAKSLTLLTEAADFNSDIAALLMLADLYAIDNLNLLKKNKPEKATLASTDLYEIPFEPAQFKDYQDTYDWLDRAAAAGSVEAICQRAIFFIKYRNKTNRKYFLPHYGIENAIRDLDLAITQEHTNAMRWRVVLAGGDDAYSCFPEAKKDDELIARLMRRVYILNADAPKEQREWDEKITHEVWLRYYQQDDRTYFKCRDPRILYHYYLFQTERTLFSHVTNLYYVFRHISLHDERLTKLMQTVMQDDMVTDKQKFYLLKKAVEYYAQQLEQFADSALPEQYGLFQQALNTMEGIAPDDDDNAFTFIIEHYEKIPLMTVAGLRAQINISNLYYDALLHSDGKEHNVLIHMLQTCHRTVEKAYSEISKNYTILDPELQNEYANYQIIIQSREASAAFVELPPIAKKSLLSRLVDWFIGLFVSPKPNGVKQEPVIMADAKNVPVPTQNTTAPAGVPLDPTHKFIFDKQKSTPVVSKLTQQASVIAVSDVSAESSTATSSTAPKMGF